MTPFTRKVSDMLSNLLSTLEQHQHVIAWGAGISLLVFVVTLIAVPLAIIAMRPDFFVRDERKASALGPLAIPARLAKNGLGVVLIGMGFVMLFVPGQGVLTILLGVSLLDFPGKRRLEIRLVRIGSVHRSINWIRRRAGKTPIQLPGEVSR
jgi:hypothetical protein